MKNIFFLLLTFGLCNAQQTEKLPVKKKDSLAFSNSNEILSSTKKHLKLKNEDPLKFSEIRKNEMELLRNVHNFNSFGGSALSPYHYNLNNFFNTNPVQISGDMLMNLPIHKK